MGTRSTTKIYNNGKPILCLYKQYDGYIEGGWGEELKKFIKSGTFVNGISARDQLVFNGIGDFALLLVKQFKEEAGGLYATTEDDSQEYNYIIEYKNDKTDYSKVTIKIKCLENPKYNETIKVVVG